MTADEYDTLVGGGTGNPTARAAASLGASDLDGICGTIGEVGERRGRPAGSAGERTGAEGVRHD